jgi:hypothetical protein
MAETTADEVVSERAPNTRGGGLAARPVIAETVAATGGAAKAVKGSGVEEEAHAEGGGRKARAFKESTEKMLSEMDKPAIAPHEIGDADEDEPGDDAAETGGEDAEGGDAAGQSEGESGDAAEVGDDAEEGEGAEAPSEVETLKATAARVEQRNRELISELEIAHKTPKTQRTERETNLMAAEQSYIEEGTVPALRKFLSVVVGAAPDSKEVDAELAGLYIDLTAKEVGVTLDQNQQALRDNARTRLLLARDKREKADAGKKAEPGDGAEEAVQYENAAKYVDNMLTVKGESGKSLADEFPMLMTLSEDFDGLRPSETLARAVRHEYMAGTLDPRGSEIDAIRVVAQKIETYYDAVADKINAARAKKTKPDTTKPSVKPKAAPVSSQEQRQSEGARTITNATASRAPAKTPKVTKQKASTPAEKARKDFPSDAAWREHLLSKHFQS